jgi:hypothetical protein
MGKYEKLIKLVENLKVTRPFNYPNDVGQLGLIRIMKLLLVSFLDYLLLQSELRC